MEVAVAHEPVRIESLDGGTLWRVVLAAPKGNVLDTAMVKALAAAAVRAKGEKDLLAVVLEGEGAHFSFGASVAEHLPGRYEAMLRGFHAVFPAILDSGVVWLAAVRGRCLGGGLELASFCHRVFAEPGALLGQPEILLGVFAPMASAWLAERVGRATAEDLCLTGRTVTAAEALRLRLVDEVADAPSAAALAWARANLAGKSASSLRFAVRAVRAGFRERFAADLARVERLYLEGLMETKDPLEGLEAFLAKRAPRWRNA